MNLSGNTDGVQGSGLCEALSIKFKFILNVDRILDCIVDCFAGLLRREVKVTLRETWKKEK